MIRKLNDNRGFSLIEVFIAMVVLSVVLLGMAGLINITVTINRNSAEKTVAITLAQDIGRRYKCRIFLSTPRTD